MPKKERVALCMKNAGGCWREKMGRNERSAIKKRRRKLAAGDRADDQEWFGASRYFGREQGVR
jgi:hypothetical protein